MQRKILFPLVFLVLMLTGCASSVQTTMQPAWTAEIGPADKVAVAEDGETIYVGAVKDAAILDARTGMPVVQINDETGLGDLLKEATTVNGVPLSSMEADELSYVFLPEADVVLLFDYSMDTNGIMAVDAKSGETLWASSRYTWTLEKFGGAGNQAVASVAKLFGGGAGTAAAVAEADLTRRRFVSDLVLPMPERDAFLFKTLDTLYLLDARTGEKIWSTDQVGGSGIGAAQMLPDGEILLATNITGLIDRLDGGKAIYRMNLDTGEVLWQMGYRGNTEMLRGIRLVDDVVLLDFEKGIAEGFDFETGEPMLESTSDWMQDWATLESTQGIGTPYSARPVLHDGHLYGMKSLNFKLVGIPDRQVVKLDMATGEQVWASETISGVSDLRDLMIFGDLIIGRGTPLGPDGTSYKGAIGHDPTRVVAWSLEDGQIAWSKEVSAGKRISNLLDIDGALYVADDDTLHAFDPATGESFAQVDAESAGIGGFRLLAQRGGELVAVGATGVAYLDPADLTVEATVESAVEAFDYVQTPDAFISVGHPGGMGGMQYTALSVVDPDTRSLTGTIGIEMKEARPQGNLGEGYYVPNSGDAVYVLHADGTLARYDL